MSACAGPSATRTSQAPGAPSLSVSLRNPRGRSRRTASRHG
ncbi:hypothetical protein [Lysobacter gummosus]